MNKAELVEILAETHNIPKTHANAYIDTILGTIMNSVASGNAVGLTGFGTFDQTEWKARHGYNPAKKTSIEIAPTCRPKFTAGTKFRALVSCAQTVSK